jgi:hypothetical protein
LHNNTPNNDIVNAASNISHRPLIQIDVFAVLFMNELKNLTNVVIGKLDKLVHKQNCSHNFLFYFINYKIIIILVRYITIETKEVACIGYNGFLFLHSYSVEGIGAMHLTSAFTCVLMGKKKPVISNMGCFFCFNSTV